MNEHGKHLERLLTDAQNAPLSADELRQYRRLARLLADWRSLPDRVDWSAYSRRVSAMVREDAETPREFRAVDDLLQSAAKPLPPVDWQALSARISAAVRSEAQAMARPSARKPRRSGALAWAVKVGVPLAAAAVIALALWGTRPATRVVTGPNKEQGASVVASVEEPKDAGKVSVTFDETKPDNMNMDDAAPQSFGSAAGPSNSEAVDPPIDPSLLP